MAGQASVSPSRGELNAQALAGDDDALRLLADVSVDCVDAKSFVERYVPYEEMLFVFDRYADAHYFAVQRRAKALLDTLELPAVESNTNAGWGG